MRKQPEIVGYFQLWPHGKPLPDKAKVISRMSDAPWRAKRAVLIELDPDAQRAMRELGIV